MEFFLAKKQKIEFGKDDLYKEGNLDFRKVSFDTSWCPVNENAGSLHNEIFSKLHGALSGKRMELEVGYWWEEMWNKARISSSDSCLQELYTTAHKEGLNITTELTIHNFGFLYNGSDTSQRTTLKATVKNTSVTPPAENKPFVLEWNRIFFSSHAGTNFWHTTSHNFDGELEILITLYPTECGCLSFLKLKDLTAVNNKLLTDRIGSDLSIIPSTGKAVPCHRAFLIAHSSTFDSLIKGTFGDSKSNFLKMPELSEMSASALIDYMYLGSTIKPEENCVVALELYTAAQKYEVKGLKDSMRKLLLLKPDNWYKVDMLMKFYDLVKCATGEENLKAKAVKLIKTNIEAIQQSESYKQLFKSDPEGAMGLMKLLFI